MQNSNRYSSNPIWLSVFPEESRSALPRECEIFTLGESTDDVVYFVEHGAVVEIRTDHVGTSHAVGLSGPGTLFGSRLGATLISRTSVRATTLIETVVRSMNRSVFLHTTLGDPELARAYMIQLARRLELVRQLSAVCSTGDSGQHILGVLHTVANVFGVDDAGTSMIPLPSSLLERMTGTPHRIIDLTLSELRSNGLVELDRDTIRWIV